MAFSCIGLDESTIDAAAPVVAERFCPEASAQLRKLLANPLRSPGDDVGVVVRGGDRVVGVTGAIVRRLYFGRESFIGVNGGFLAMRRDAPPTMLFALLKQAHRPKGGSVLFYSNTCSPATAKMKPCVGVKNQGPDSWASVRIARLRHYPSLRRRVKRGLGISLPLRMPFAAAPVAPSDCARSGRVFAADDRRGISVKARLDFAWADGFFGRYLSGNKGIVGSRTTEELAWIFGGGVASGRSILLTAEGPNGVDGYIVACPCPYDASFWQVADAIAVGNDVDVLDMLLSAAKRAVMACSDAERLEVIGFPMWFQQVVDRHFPKSRQMPCNGFMWGFSDAEMAQRCAGAMQNGGMDGWFFGPYDGDFCLCQK